jgi:hypothetical protein
LGLGVEPIFHWGEELSMANSAYRFDVATRLTNICVQFRGR